MSYRLTHYTLIIPVATAITPITNTNIAKYMMYLPCLRYNGTSFL